MIPLTPPRRLFPPRELQAFTVLHLVLTVVCLGAEALCASVWRLSYPYTFPVLFFQDWIDLFCFRPRFSALHQAAFFSDTPALGLHFMYPAPIALLYGSFYAAGPHTLALFLSFTLALTAVLAAVVLREAIRRGLPPIAGLSILGSAILLGYPFWFEYVLGNMEICIFLLVAYGVLAYVRNHVYTAAAIFGVAASMKLFPFIFFGLLLARRQYRQIAFGASISALVTLGSLWYLCRSPAVAWRGIADGLDRFKQLYMLPYREYETGFDHSIFGLIKRLDFHHRQYVYPTASLLSLYLPAAATLGVVLYFAVIRKLPLLNQILVLTVASILLPPTSHDYTLLHLYTPWALLLLFSLRTPEGRQKIRGLLPVFLCFAILLAPETEFIHDDRVLGGQLKCLTLITLFGLGLLCPFPDPALDPNRTKPSLKLSALHQV